MMLAFLVYSHFCHSRREQWLDLRESVIALFYCTNWGLAFDFLRPTFLGHTWSLSIEEQFYLVWPLTLILLLRKCTAQLSFSLVLLLAVLGGMRSVFSASGHGGEPGARFSRIGFPRRSAVDGMRSGSGGGIGFVVSFALAGVGA